MAKLAPFIIATMPKHCDSYIIVLGLSICYLFKVLPYLSSRVHIEKIIYVKTKNNVSRYEFRNWFGFCSSRINSWFTFSIKRVKNCGFFQKTKFGDTREEQLLLDSPRTSLHRFLLLLLGQVWLTWHALPSGTAKEFR